MSVSHYQVNLTVKGLVHIGNGKEYGKKDYFPDEKNKRICVLDSKKFIGLLNSDKLDSYCQNLLESNEKRSPGLEKWLKKEKLFPTAKKAISYKLNANLQRNKHNNPKYFNVAEFVKTSCAQKFCPYIPGSSFKGALRTALLAAIIASDSDNKYIDDYRKNKKNANDKIQREVFCQDGSGSNDALNDIMRFVSVSDSELLDVSDLVLAQKCDRLPKTDEKGGDNRLNVYRECLNAGTKISLQVDVDERINKYLKDNECLSYDLNAEGIARVFREFNERYKECFLNHFDTSDIVSNKENASETANDYENWCHYMVQFDFGDHVEEVPCKMPPIGHTGYCEKHQNEAQQISNEIPEEHKACCYLGGGVDFDSKTILNALFTNENERLKEISNILCSQFPENHRQDQNLGVSPHTLKLGFVDGQLYLMGQCELSITEL